MVEDGRGMICIAFQAKHGCCELSYPETSSRVTVAPLVASFRRSPSPIVSC